MQTNDALCAAADRARKAEAAGASVRPHAGGHAACGGQGMTKQRVAPSMFEERGIVVPVPLQKRALQEEDEERLALIVRRKAEEASCVQEGTVQQATEEEGTVQIVIPCEGM